MSLILEALKKAERQHRIGEVPSLGSAPDLESSGHSGWMGFLLLGIFALAMLILGVYLGRDDTPKETVGQELSFVAPIDSKPQVLQAQRPAEPKPSPIKEVQPLQASSSIETVIEPIQPIEVEVAVPSVPKPLPAPLQLSELPPGFLANLPTLNIDIHSYDENPGRRYVLINLEKYREGDYLSEGPLLSEILPDGVVLEHLGERFILPIGNH